MSRVGLPRDELSGDRCRMFEVDGTVHWTLLGRSTPGSLLPQPGRQALTSGPGDPVNGWVRREPGGMIMAVFVCQTACR